MIPALAEALNLLAVQREGGAVSSIFLARDEVSLLTVENVADPRSPERVRLQAAHLEDQLCVAVIEHADLRVGGFAIIQVAKSAADADHGPGQFVLAQTPAGYVHL